MGEYINASIKFGGQLERKRVDELLDLLNEKHLWPDWSPSGEVTVEDLEETAFYANSEVNYGNLDELRSFAEDAGLWYEYECGAGPEWDAQTIFYNPITKESREFVGEQDTAITLEKIKELGSYEAVLAYFERTLPPFELVGDWPEVECANCDWKGAEEDLNPIKDLGQRVEPGEIMPAGECPECGCLAHVTDREAERRSDEKWSAHDQQVDEELRTEALEMEQRLVEPIGPPPILPPEGDA